MNVKNLRELLAEAPDDMPVMVMVQDHLKPGMFAFAEACSCEAGITELGPDENNKEDGLQVFLVLPHGTGVTEQEIEEGDVTIPELN